MPELILPTRRGFLVGLLATGLAPAIVRAESLMPIKVFETYGPNGLLTPEMITREALRLLRQRVSPISHLLTVRGSSQSHVDFTADLPDMAMSLETFSERRLKPVICALASHVNLVGAPPMLPQAVAGAVAEHGGMGVRYMSDYFIGTDQMIHRFDVTNS